MAAKKLIYPAANRNKNPILLVLQQYISQNENRTLLEISSGSGQHVAHFAPHFPLITFYPSECEETLLNSILAHTEGLPNVKKPLKIDITTNYKEWGNGIFEEQSLDYIYNANMMHIAPFECSVGLFENVGKLLKSDGILFTYGPYAIDGKITPASNASFHKSLQSQNSSWGLRDICDLKKLAEKNQIQLEKIIDMPANNKTIIWKKC